MIKDKEMDDMLNEEDFNGLTCALSTLRKKMNSAREHLTPIFDAAIEQAESGKGNERHGHGMDFMEPE